MDLRRAVASAAPLGRLPRRAPVGPRRLRLDKFESPSLAFANAHGGSGMDLRRAVASAAPLGRLPRRAPVGPRRLRLDKFESPSLAFANAHGGSGIRTHVVPWTNALAGRRF